MSKTYFEFDRRLKRYNAGELTLPLGIVPAVEIDARESYTYEFYPDIAETGEDQYCFAAVVDSSRIGEVFETFFKYFHGPVKVVLTYLSYDFSRMYDNYRSATECRLDDVLKMWDRFRDYFVEDGTVGFGFISIDPLMELLIDEHGEVRFYCPMSIFDDVCADFSELGVPVCEEYWPYFYRKHVNRPVLKTGGQNSTLMDEFDIRYQFTLAFDLELLIDEESELDENEDRIGDSPWFGVFRLGAKQGARLRGRLIRGGWVTMGIFARNYREAKEFAESEIANTEEFEHIEWVMELYRVKDEHLDEDAREALKSSPIPGVHYVGEFETW